MARLLAIFAGIAALIAFPLLTNEFLVSVSIVTGIYVILMVGLALFLGYGGQFSFAQSVFYGIGAYTSASLTTKFNIPVVYAFLAGGALAGVAAYLLSAPLLRLRGYYLAVATLAMCQIFQVLISENVNITGGPSGIYSIPPFSVLGFVFETSRSYYYLVWGVAIACLFFTRNVMDSAVGRALKAIKSSEDAALVMGINVVDLQTRIFVFAGITGGLAGSFYAHYVSYISPNSFTIDLSIWLVIVLTVGGVRSVSGVILGAAFTTVFPFLLGRYQTYNMLIFGIIFLLVLKYMPNGIAGHAQVWVSQFRQQRVKPHE